MHLFTVIVFFIVASLAAAGLYILFLFIPRFDKWLFLTRLKYRGRKIAALTFDDGPDEPYTSRILDILRENKIRATFFVLGKKSRDNPNVIRRIAREGHEIGNHTMSHKKLMLQDKKDIANDIIGASNILAGITGELPALFRSPHGFKTPGLGGILGRLGLRLMPWTKGIWDTDGSAPEILLERFERRFSNLEILLLHDGLDATLTSSNRDATVAALPRIIEEYRKRGYGFVKAGEL